MPRPIKNLSQARPLFLLMAVTTTLVVIYFSLTPPSVSVQPLPWWQHDKVLHTLSYFVLECTYFLSLLKLKRPYTTTAMAAFLLGLLLEVLQSLPFFQRTFDWFDLLANGFGIGLALLGLKYFCNKQST